MSLRRPSKNQPDKFEFNASSLEAANSIVSKYPKEKQQSEGGRRWRGGWEVGGGGGGW